MDIYRRSPTNRLTDAPIISLIAGFVVKSTPTAAPQEAATTDTKALREKIEELIGGGVLKPGWIDVDFAKGCRSKSFATQKDFEAFVFAVRTMAGTGRGKTDQRNLFAFAIGYKKDPNLLPAYLGRIFCDIVKANSTKLKSLDRPKRGT